VIKNVMLVPPPALSKNVKRSTAEGEEVLEEFLTDSKATELFREPLFPGQSQDMKTVRGDLNLNNKQSRFSSFFMFSWVDCLGYLLLGCSVISVSFII
jgi:hypothetical protein